MKNLFKKIINKEKDIEDADIFRFGKKVFSEINPEKELLSKILDKTETQNVTNVELVRNTIREEDGRGFKINPFSSLLENMSKFIKILSGTAVVSAIVLTIIFVGKDKTKEAIPIAKTQDSVVVIGGESINVDSLVAESFLGEEEFSEPMLSDSDLLLEEINTNDYEIQ